MAHYNRITTNQPQPNIPAKCHNNQDDSTVDLVIFIGTVTLTATTKYQSKERGGEGR